jgi:hypothetical protein
VQDSAQQGFILCAEQKFSAAPKQPVANPLGGTDSKSNSCQLVSIRGEKIQNNIDMLRSIEVKGRSTVGTEGN